MSQQSVLYDAPGPRTRVRHWIYSAVVIALIAALVVFVVVKLNGSGHTFGL